LPADDGAPSSNLSQQSVLHAEMFLQTAGVVKAEERLVSDQPVSEFVDFMFDRLSYFVEEVTAHRLAGHLASGITITEVPFDQ
jgi:hypothetical protein